MLILKNLENSFINSSFKVKAELYLLVVIIFILLVYNTPFFNTIKKSPSLNDVYKIKEFNMSLLDINKKIEEYASAKKIRIISMNNKKKEISILCSLSLLKVKSFIYYLENLNAYSNIESLIISKSQKSKKYTLDVRISFKRYYFKSHTNKKLVKKKKSHKFTLKAIIDKNVLINNSWLEVGEYINKYKLTKVSKDSVILSFDNKNIKLKVFKNEKY